MEEEVVLCAASAYEQKFYLNPQFESLPEAVRQELQIMCENDFAFDEIGSVLKIKQLQQTKRELFESLETFYRVFYLGEE